jgi:hypothetical protein
VRGQVAWRKVLRGGGGVELGVYTHWQLLLVSAAALTGPLRLCSHSDYIAEYAGVARRRA